MQSAQKASFSVTEIKRFIPIYDSLGESIRSLQMENLPERFVSDVTFCFRLH